MRYLTKVILNYTNFYEQNNKPSNINTNTKVSVLEEEVLLLKATMKIGKPYSARKIMIVLCCLSSSSYNFRCITNQFLTKLPSYKNLY